MNQANRSHGLAMRMEHRLAGGMTVLVIALDNVGTKTDYDQSRLRQPGRTLRLMFLLR